MEREEARLKKEIRSLVRQARKTDARAGTLQAAQVCRGAPVWMDQVGPGIPGIYSTGAGQGTGEWNLVCLALNLRRMGTVMAGS